MQDDIGNRCAGLKDLQETVGFERIRNLSVNLHLHLCDIPDWKVARNRCDEKIEIYDETYGGFKYRKSDYRTTDRYGLASHIPRDKSGYEAEELKNCPLLNGTTGMTYDELI